MDFSQRTSRPASTGEQPSSESSTKTKSKRSRSVNNMKVFSVVLLYSVTILLVALAIYTFVLGGRSNNQEKFVAADKYQAVFLNGGQVYFGKVTNANDKYMTLADIYYLKVNQTVQPGQPPKNEDISLVKLGCELHGPYDQMVINQDQVIFWENLKDDGQVVKAVKQFQQQNPEGLKCEQPAQSNDQTKKP